MAVVRRTREERAQIIARFRRSGLTRREFAQSIGLKLGTLDGWLAKHKAETRRLSTADGPALVRVTPTEPSSMIAERKAGSMPSEDADGVVVLFASLPSPEYLASVAQALQRC